MKWKMLKLSDCCLSIADGDHLPPPKAETGVPFVTIANISNNEFDFSNTMFVPQDMIISMTSGSQRLVMFCIQSSDHLGFPY